MLIGNYGGGILQIFILYMGWKSQYRVQGKQSQKQLNYISDLDIVFIFCFRFICIQYYKKLKTVYLVIVYSGDKKGILAIINLIQYIIKIVGSMKNFVCVEVCLFIFNFFLKQSYFGYEFEIYIIGEEKYL